MDVQKLQSLVEVPIEEWDKLFADLPADPIPVGATTDVVLNFHDRRKIFGDKSLTRMEKAVFASRCGCLNCSPYP